MTSDFAFYQYFMRLEDGDAASMLPLLSEDPDPDAGVSAQQTLARRVTRSVRGPEAVRRAEALTSLLYGHTSGAGFSPADVLAAAREADAPPTPVAAHSSASAAACKAGLCASNNEARRLELAGGLYVNGERAEAGRVLRAEDFSQGVALLRAGKARWAVLRLADG
jgi:tyrosyl-tRNA synthetase